MSKLTRLSVEERNDLVAYLDGELEDAATQRIEQVLSQSPVARNDVELLVKTYDLLDLLPRPRASSEFTNKTIATARMSEVKVSYAQSAAFQKLRKLLPVLGYTLLAAAGGFAGFAVTNRMVPLESDVLLKELPVIERMDEYIEVGDMQFLEKLGNEPSLLRDLQAEVSRERR